MTHRIMTYILIVSWINIVNLKKKKLEIIIIENFVQCGKRGLFKYFINLKLDKFRLVIQKQCRLTVGRHLLPVTEISLPHMTGRI
jgi:hypothetical protein